MMSERKSATKFSEEVIISHQKFFRSLLNHPRKVTVSKKLRKFEVARCSTLNLNKKELLFNNLFSSSCSIGYNSSSEIRIAGSMLCDKRPPKVHRLGNKCCLLLRSISDGRVFVTAINEKCCKNLMCYYTALLDKSRHSCPINNVSSVMMRSSSEEGKVTTTFRRLE